MSAAERIKELSAALRAGPQEVVDALAEVTGDLVGRLDERDLSRWADLVVALVDESPPAAAAFIRSTPEVLEHLEPAQLETWFSNGRRLLTGGWRSTQLASRFFAQSGQLLALVELPRLEGLVDAVAVVAVDEPDLASSCLSEIPAILGALDPPIRAPFIDLLEELLRHARPDAYDCLRRFPGLIANTPGAVGVPLVELARRVVEEVGAGGFDGFVAAAEAVPLADPGEVDGQMALAGEIARYSASAAVEFLALAPEVWEKAGADEAQRWAGVGAELLADRDGDARAASWFRLESAEAQSLLALLTGRVELAEVSGVLGRYAQALSGHALGLHPRALLGSRHIGWASEGKATTDGIGIFLPPAIEVFDDHSSNFSVYKVLVTQQTARLEFGSFDFRFGADGHHLIATYMSRGVGDPGRDVTPMTRFFDLFPDRALVVALFGLVEGTRIDSLVSDRYPGMRAQLRRVQVHEAESRPLAGDLPLRELLVENLIRVSLGCPDLMDIPGDISAAQVEAVSTLEVVSRPDATVQDSAEVTDLLYDLAAAIPNHVGRGRSAAGGTERPFTAPAPPEMRGDFKPELVQLLSEMTERVAAEGPDLAPEDLLDSVIEVTTELDGDDPDDREAMTTALAEEVKRRAIRLAPAAEGDDGADGEVVWFRYDEWDFHARDYRPAWCRVGEMVGEEGELDFYLDTLSRRHNLVVSTRRQFEKMRPEAFRRLKRLEDGHEIDLDEAIQFHADKLAGVGPQARFYSRRDKVTRDVAVAFLLDMSASTNEELTPADGTADTSRIIDVEKEAAVVMVEALEAIGDRYGIFGFSGEGRESVEFRVIKEIDEELDDRVRRRIGRIEPVRSTRMGPAIRHTITKLDACDAKVKILVLVSDGRPMDEEYGFGATEREYAVQDTRQALTEARRRRIEPFLITVDSEGHEYLSLLCGDLGYEVVDDVGALPKRLPRLYERVAIR